MEMLYIHIPFCVRKCRYCDFVSFPLAGDTADAYLGALEREAAQYAGRRFGTVFIGGGTPSVLSAAQLTRLFGIISSSFTVENGAEFSIEVNPGTLDEDKIASMIRGGVNRVSVGVQSFNDGELDALGRIHTSEQAVKAVEDLRSAGISNINIDLMTSTPAQTARTLRQSLETAVSLNAAHISAYSLILEEGTPLYGDYERGAFVPISDDEDRDNFAALVKFLAQNGFERYEISNFAKPGYECRHNIGYWECREYLGLGLAAHSYLDGKRFRNVSDMNNYMRGNFRSPDTLTLTRADMMSEFVIMGLRMTRGISEAEFERRFKTTLESVYPEQLKRFTYLDLMAQGGGRYYLTARGMDVSNAVMCEFIAD